VRGLISFHPVDLAFFDDVIAPLVVGEKINPEAFLGDARRMRATSLQVEPYRQGLVALLARLEPPAPPTEGSMWTKVKAKLEQLDQKPDPLATLVASRIDPDLHLRGRPFLVTEGSADHVAALVEEFRKADGQASVESLILEQLVRIEPTLPQTLELPELPQPSSDMAYRTELLERLKAVHSLAKSARENESWGPATGRRVPAREVLGRELPWRAVELHACTSPFWIAHDVDGLETVCRAAEIALPEMLVTGRRLFARAIEAFPELAESLTTELRDGRDVGAFVPPDDVQALLAFLQAEGAKIIRVATQHGEGASCATLLRKIRECAEYAAAHGRGYLEASGVRPLAEPPPDEEEGAA
jgi:hypothetical protein